MLVTVRCYLWWNCRSVWEWCCDGGRCSLWAGATAAGGTSGSCYLGRGHGPVGCRNYRRTSALWPSSAPHTPPVTHDPHIRVNHEDVWRGWKCWCVQRLLTSLRSVSRFLSGIFSRRHSMFRAMSGPKIDEPGRRYNNVSSCRGGFKSVTPIIISLMALYCTLLFYQAEKWELCFRSGCLSSSHRGQTLLQKHVRPQKWIFPMKHTVTVQNIYIDVYHKCLWG